MSLTLKEYQERNIAHSAKAFPECKDWVITDWTNAIAGEAGEACNIAKKVRRGDFTISEAKKAILKELADTMCYCSILMSVMRADIEEVVNDKYDEIVVRHETKLETHADGAKEISVDEFLGIPVHEPGECSA